VAGEFDAKASTFLDLGTLLNSAKMTKSVISRRAPSPASSRPRTSRRYWQLAWRWVD